MLSLPKSIAPQGRGTASGDCGGGSQNYSVVELVLGRASTDGGEVLRRWNGTAT